MLCRGCCFRTVWIALVRPIELVLDRLDYDSRVGFEVVCGGLVQQLRVRSVRCETVCCRYRDADLMMVLVIEDCCVVLVR